MKGFAVVDEAVSPPGDLAAYEARAVDAVGVVIEFWGFKRNHGRVWALLYLRGRALSALEIQEALGLSKGAVSMVTRELEQWGVIRRVRAASDASWRFVAETELMRMIRRVLEDREAALVARVRADLDDAERLAAQARVAPEVLARLKRMNVLASLMDKALRAFLATARLDVGDAVAAFEEARARRRSRT